MAAVLATFQHHSAPRGPRTARTEGGARDELHGPAPEDAPPRAASTLYFNLDDDEGVLAARPDRLYDVRPQDRVLRRTVEQNVDVFSYPLLDVLQPQMGDQLVEVLRKIDTRSSHQVIEVPKVFSVSAPLRRVESRPPQTAEQFVEVPTIISYSSLQQTVERTIDIPVPHDRSDRGGGGGLQGFSPGQGSTAYSGADFVDIPVPGRGGRNVGLQGFPPRQSSTVQLASQKRSSERIVEQIVDSRVLGGGLQDFRPVQGSSSSSSRSREHAGEGVFRTFPRGKKSPKLGSRSGSELLPESSPSTLSAHQMAPSGLLWSQDECTEMVDDNGHAWVRLDTARGSLWQNLDTGHQQWRPPWEH